MSGERKCTLTWPEFEKEAQEFLKLAENHSDPWTWQTQVSVRISAKDFSKILLFYKMWIIFFLII